MSAKERFFDGDRFILSQQSENTRKRWTQEAKLTDCGDCPHSQECIYCYKTVRFPADAGGEAQCIRLAQYQSKYAFENANHQIIIIPDEIIDRIKDSVIAAINGQE